MNILSSVQPVTGLVDPSRDLASRLLPFEHAALIHPPENRSCAIFRGSRIDPATKRWGDFTFACRGEWVDEEVARKRPRFVTMHGFRTRSACYKNDWREFPWKEASNLAALQAIWAEVDFYKKPAWKHLTPVQMVVEIRARTRAKGWPDPSYILCSGRGLHVVWLHTRVSPRGALRLWTAVQQHLNDALIDMGRDKAAMAVTTNLRLAGTKNEGRTVEMLWPVYVDEIVRHDFDALRTAILPYSIEEARAYKAKLKADKAARVARIQAPTGTPRLTGTTFYATLLADLQKVMDDRFPGVIEEGYRNEMLFIHARIWAWMMDDEELVARIKAEAPRFGFTPREAVTHMRSVINRAKRVYTVGSKIDPRYKIGPQRIRIDLGITAREAKRLDLRMLIPPSLRRQRAAERAEKSRRSRGAACRGDQQAQRLEHGHEALRLREGGLTRLQIAERLGGVSPGYVDKAIKEAKAVAAIGAVKRPSKPVPDEDAIESEILDRQREKRIADREAEALARQASHGSSRYMADDVDVLVADKDDAYHHDVRGVAPPSSEEQQRPVGSPGGPFAYQDRYAETQRISQEYWARHQPVVPLFLTLRRPR